MSIGVKMKRRAFSLVEILVVMAIIAILAGLIFPSLRRTVAASKVTVSMNNTHQIGLAMHLYRESVGEYPIAGTYLDSLAPYGITPADYLYSPVDFTRTPYAYGIWGRGFLPPIDKQFKECQDERGSSYILVTDTSLFAKANYRYVGLPTLIVTREDLSASVIKNCLEKAEVLKKANSASKCNFIPWFQL